MTRLGGLMKANTNATKDTLAEPSVLNISTNSIASGSDNAAQAEPAPADGEKPNLTAQGTAHHKHGHKRGKSKEKISKQKADSQPERECTVM